MTSIAIEKSATSPEVKQPLTLAEFLSLPDLDASYELVEGEAIKKMSPKFFHSRLTASFWSELSSWSHGFGQVAIATTSILLFTASLKGKPEEPFR
ncbi:Uma2 family endonuclease [Pseudanabaena sp. FACHB-1998]|uniref:Uma2 family endonuclease n=1 Tax=Pseudanabaena sp. FACHB-1998 TaxID=2692858 RepID=UPI001680A394|nr:Uma2 family endonuclease [Pseudanabaena sp. FACHB-1998]MBD2175880.1 Uma2 family endonuclease [Pseudanabaena sp. FACHB-1998]